MKYKVIKEFGSLKKGDVLENSVEDPQIFTFSEETEHSYREISISDDFVEFYEEEGYLQRVKEPCAECPCAECPCAECPCDRVAKTLTLIKNLKEQYQKDNDEITEKYSNNELPYCAKLEADTVHSNLIKVLNKIEASLNE